MYKFLVCPNPEEHELNANNVSLCSSENNKEDAIHLMSRKFPLSVICVYSLDEMQKVTGKPTYARYKRQPNGEIIPV